ncbi:MAG: hypothetical protein OEW08_11975 [Gammaproteobacteria bacterium]|nr:hypothetical protein [Gammaproteobacteria bacterium]
MLQKLLQAFFLTALFPTFANATLIGRVNSYYAQAQRDKVESIQKELDAAIINRAEKDRILLTKTEALNNAGKKIGDGSPEAKEVGEANKDADTAQKAVEVKRAELNIARSSLALQHASSDGPPVSSLSSASISNTSGGGNAIDVNAYQFTVALWAANCDNGKKKHLLSVGGTDCQVARNDIRGRRFVPLYVLFHKTMTSTQSSGAVSPSPQSTLKALSNDLLNNEYGGLVNLKLTPSLLENRATDPIAPRFSLFGDLGYKHVEQPTANSTTTSYVGAGYVGLGFNAEFSVFNPSPTDLTLKNTKPSGYLAIGIGIHRNFLSGVDDTLFSGPVPRRFYSAVLSGEMQITNVISIVASHGLAKSPNPLGSYSSVSIRFQQ